MDRQLWLSTHPNITEEIKSAVVLMENQVGGWSRLSVLKKRQPYCEHTYDLLPALRSCRISLIPSPILGIRVNAIFQIETCGLGWKASGSTAENEKN